MLRKGPFKCQACTSDVLSVSVDGNCKYYHLKNAARLEEQAIFQDLFIAKDENVGKFVDYTQINQQYFVVGNGWEISHRSSSKLEEEAWSERYRWTQILCQGSSQDQKGENILALDLEDVGHLKTGTDTEVLSLEEILSGDTTLPWQPSYSDSQSSLKNKGNR